MMLSAPYTKPVILESECGEGVIRMDEHHLTWIDHDKNKMKIPLYAISYADRCGMFATESLCVKIMTDSKIGGYTNRWMQMRIVIQNYGDLRMNSKKHVNYWHNTQDTAAERRKWLYEYVSLDDLFITETKMKFDLGSSACVKLWTEMLNRYVSVQRDYEGVNPHYVVIHTKPVYDAMVIFDYDKKTGRVGYASSYSTPAPQYFPPRQTVHGARIPQRRRIM